MNFHPSSHSLSPGILFLKHDSSILRQSSNPVCGSWKSQVSSLWAKQSLIWSIKSPSDKTERTVCSLLKRTVRSHIITSAMDKPHTCLGDHLRILLSCFRKRTSVFHVIRCIAAKDFIGLHAVRNDDDGGDTDDLQLVRGRIQHDLIFI